MPSIAPVAEKAQQSPVQVKKYLITYRRITMIDTALNKNQTNVFQVKWLSTKSPDTGTRDTKDTKIRESDTDTVTPGIRTCRIRFIYTYIYF